jgi:excisionase family DNA binding protein
VAPKLLTVQEVATILRVTPNTVYRWVKRGRLPVVRLGYLVRVPASAIENLIPGAGQCNERGLQPESGFAIDKYRQRTA